jgi:hypothetical protein
MSSTNPPDIIVLKCPQCGANISGDTNKYLVCQYCGTSLVYNRQDAESDQARDTVVRGMRLKKFSYTDTQGTGLELFQMLVPVGWQFQGGCQWFLDNPGMPAAVAFQIWNPNGSQVFEVLPNMNLTWNNSPLSGMIFPTGSRYFGAEVRSPMSIHQALRGLVLPRYRKAMQNLEILSFEPLPDLPSMFKSEAPLSDGSAEGGKLRIRYTFQDAQFDEDIYGVVEVFRTPIASMFGTSEVIYWFVDYLFSFRTAAGRLDATADLFYVMISSFQLNPHWYAAYKSIVQFLAQQQIQHIHHIGQIGDIMAQTGRELREQNLKDWYSRQEVYDRIDTKRSRVNRGVDGFYDPHRQEVVELPSGYGHAWANNLGEYILTEDSFFNPNLYSNLHWEPMPEQ